MTEVTRILLRIQDGESDAERELWPLVYDELRKLAAYRLKTDPNTPFKPTELVHEAYLRMVNVERAQHWESRSHFFATAGQAMRRILIDRARRSGRIKRGRNAQRIDLDADLIAVDERAGQLLAIDEAVSTLEDHDPKAASVVILRFFGGMKHIDAADALGITRREADRLWVVARTWLYKWLDDHRS